MNDFALPADVTRMRHVVKTCACCDRAREVVAVFESDRAGLHHLMFEAVEERDALRERLGEAKAALEPCLGESHLCADHNRSCRVCVQRAVLSALAAPCGEEADDG